MWKAKLERMHRLWGVIILRCVQGFRQSKQANVRLIMRHASFGVGNREMTLKLHKVNDSS